MQGRPSGIRTIVGLAVACCALVAPQAASGAIGSVFGGDVSCNVQGDGVRFCGSSNPRSTTKAFDGVPIDVNVAFPPERTGAVDGNYPLIMIFHGYGGGKLGLNAMQPFLERGFATFSMTNRGFRESCGSAASRTADPSGCERGYVRLIDNRYEVRDAQEFAAELADQGLIDGQRIGATGGSYGGGMSMALAALRDRKVLEDGSLVPWTSPAGKQMTIAAAAANIPWTDLAYSLTPNGSTLDYVADAPYAGRIGVMKESFVNGLYLSGLAAPGYYAPEGSDPSADITGWRNLLLAGEPYTAGQAVIDEITTHHSSYYIDDSTKPAPLLISNGFTDDLFPADEGIRFYNRTRTEYPGADIAMFFGDFGHQRGQNKPDVTDLLTSRQLAWLDHYVAGTGPEPRQGVEAMTETCPASAPSGGPFTAKNWARMARGEIRVARGATRTIAPDATSGGTFDPIAGGSACTTADGADIPGSATYRLDPAPAGGYTLIGAPTVIADFTLPGDTSQVAARLLDVAPDGQETLVARGLWRPETGGPAKQVFQLHPNGWLFAEGHVPKLELLANDANPAGGALTSYGRASNDQQPVTVAKLKLRLPVLELPGSFAGMVRAPAPKFVPEGYELARDFTELPEPGAKVKGKLKVTGSTLRTRVKCPNRFAACTDGSIAVRAAGGSAPGKRARGRFKVAAGRFEADGGTVTTVRMKLTPRARRYFRTHRKLRVAAKVRTHERVGAWKGNRKAVVR